MAAVFLCAVAAPGVDATGPAPAGAVQDVPAAATRLDEVPGDARKAIGRRWSGWTQAPASGACDATAGPLALSFDADGDARPDVAVPVQTADGIHLVVVIYRPWDVDVAHDLGPVPGSSGRLALRVAAAGTEYQTPGAEFPRYFSNATLVASDCTGSDVAYLWNGLEFRATPLASAG